jgi:hypothetical protein
MEIPKAGMVIRAAKENRMNCPAKSFARLLVPVLVAALAAAPAYAQQPQNTVAKLQDIQGNVLVSQGDGMAAGATNQRLAVGTRVVTMAGSKVTINFDVGCDITLPENSRFTVRLGECAALGKEVVALGPAEGAIGGGAAGATVAAAGASGTGIGTIVGVGALAVGGAAAYLARRNKPVSPS